MAGTKKKFIPMSFERYGSFKNCYINKKVANWLKLQNPIVSRYMLYSNFKGAAEKSHLTFVSPDKWVDPFEKIYLNTKLKNFPSNKNYKPFPIVCLCFTRHRLGNSDAFWKSFKTNANQQLVRVEFLLKQLIEQICSLAKQVNVYFSAVNYQLSPDEIKDEVKFISKILGNNAKKINLEELYVKMLSYKRQAFEYEEEMRIFLVPKKGNTLKIDHEKGFYQLEKFDYFKATEHIYLEPLPSGWVTKKMVKNDLSILSEKISQSVIYKKQKECEQVSFKDLEISKKEDF